MSSYWRVVPTFRLARQLCRDNFFGPFATHHFARDRFFNEVFRAWAAHSELYKRGAPNEAYKKHWEEFMKDMNDSFGVRIPWKEETNTETKADEPQRDHTEKVTETRDAMDPAPRASHPTQDFKVALDLNGFAPDEVSVKIVGNTLRVEARHESKTDGGHVLRSYRQEFLLPADVDLDALKSSLNADGMLNLTATRRGAPAERAVPIDVAAAEQQPADQAADAVSDGTPTPGSPETDARSEEAPEENK